MCTLVFLVLVIIYIVICRFGRAAAAADRRRSLTRQPYVVRVHVVYSTAHVLFATYIYISCVSSCIQRASRAKTRPFRLRPHPRRVYRRRFGISRLLPADKLLRA